MIVRTFKVGETIPPELVGGCQIRVIYADDGRARFRFGDPKELADKRLTSEGEWVKSSDSKPAVTSRQTDSDPA